MEITKPNDNVDQNNNILNADYFVAVDISRGERAVSRWWG